MIPVLSLLLVLALSMILIRVASVALVHTGLARESAVFQARSAFTGVGFTTGEAEQVVEHPVRRRIIMALMLVGNVGFVTLVSTLMLSFLGVGAGRSSWTAVLVLGIGVATLFAIAGSARVERLTSRMISRALNRWTSIDARDYAGLLHLRDDYGVCELRVQEGDWVSGRSLGDAGLFDEGLLVLGIECPGRNFIGAPRAHTEVRAGDRLILYGRTPRISELDQRRLGGPGDDSHENACSEQDAIGIGEHAQAGR